MTVDKLSELLCKTSQRCYFIFFFGEFFFSSLDVHKRCPNYIQDTGISHLAHENTSFKANNTLLLSLIILHKQ